MFPTMKDDPRPPGSNRTPPHPEELEGKLNELVERLGHALDSKADEKIKKLREEVRNEIKHVNEEIERLLRTS